MKAKSRYFARACALTILCLSSCSLARSKGSLLVPVGRRAPGEVSVSVDSKSQSFSLIQDGSGGSWLSIPMRELKGARSLELRLRISSSAVSEREADIDAARWTSPCALIDSDDPSIKAKASSLAAGRDGREGIARSILSFAQGMEFKLAPGMHRKKASTSLADGYGICVNHSRVFVALCRAAGVPARSVSGTLSSPGRDGHHEWAEYYGDDSRWHAVDPVADFDLDSGPAEPRHVDLVYDIESNPIYPFSRGWERSKVALKDGDVSVFCADWRAQERDARMGYRRVDSGGGAPAEAAIDYDLKLYVTPD